MNNRAENAPLKVLCTNGLKSVFLETGQELSSKIGVSFSAEYGSTKKFTDRVAEGDSPDVVILTDEAIDTLIGAWQTVAGPHRPGQILYRRRCPQGHARAGYRLGPGLYCCAPRRPRDLTLEAGRQRAAYRCGPQTPRYRRRTGAENKIYDGTAAQACADGEVDIAIQQISELMPVAELEIVGPLPSELQKVTIFSAGIGASTSRRAAAEKFIGFIKSGERASVLRTHGLEPA